MTSTRDGKIWVSGMDSFLSGQTLSSLETIEKAKLQPEIRVLPDVWVIKMGGQSIMDRGREAIFPIMEELIAAKNEGIQFILGLGGGTRARHVYAQAIELNLPTGMLAKLGAGIPLQNARMMQLLMAKDGGIMVYPEDFEKLPLFFQMGCIPIMSGMPPNEFWEKPAAVSSIPANRTDTGVYLAGEFIGAKGVIYIKDEDGLYTDDPKKNPDAQLIENADAQELLDSGQDDLIVERIVLEYMTRATHIKEIRFINGLKKGSVLAALRGENVGSTIRAS